MPNTRGLGNLYDRIVSAWDSLAPWQQYGLIFIGFLAFFLVLLLPVTLSGSILGTVDTLFGPALSNTFLNRIRQMLFGVVIGESMYPADIARYGETGVGLASIFMLFRAVGLDDVYSLYFTQALLLASMALATVLFARQYTDHRSSAVLAAFVFTTSNYVWADIDHLPIHFYFFPLLSACFLKRAIRRPNPKLLLAAGVVGGLEIYFSVQVYIYQTLLLGVIALFGLRELWKGYSWKVKGLFVACYAFIPLPLVLYYLNTVVNLGVVDVFPRTSWEDVYSLQLSDFRRALPNKLIEYPFTLPSEGGWPRVAHSAFAGLAAPLLSLVGLIGLNRQKLELVAIGGLGLLFSLGTTIGVGDLQVPSPLLLFYRHVPLAQYLRVAHRAYSVFLLAMSILAGLGWERLARGLGKANRVLPSVGLFAVFAFVAMENISWPLNSYETMRYPAIPAGYAEFFRDNPDALILDLPSNSTTWPDYIDEVIYVIWQTKHERSILGGVSGYYPPSRIETQHYVDQLPSAEAFAFFRDLGVTHFVWHNSSFLVCHQPHSELDCDPATGRRPVVTEADYAWMEASPFLTRVFENDAIRIYELHREPSAAAVDRPWSSDPIRGRTRLAGRVRSSQPPRR